MKLEQLFENENNLITPTKFKNYYLEIGFKNSEEFSLKCVEFTSKWGLEDVLYNCKSTTDGYKNTVQMYLHGNELAKKILNLVIDEKDDWYIPAKDELDHIYKSKIVNIHFHCWSSTECNIKTSWLQSFYSGSQSNFSKNNTNFVLPVRRVYEK